MDQKKENIYVYTCTMNAAFASNLRIMALDLSVRTEERIMV